MKTISYLFTVPLLAALSILPSSLHAADDAAAAEARMRDALRSVTLQLREAQSQVASLQSVQAQLEQDKLDQKGQIEGLNKQVDKGIAEAKTAKELSEKTIAGLEGKVDDQSKRITKLNEVLEKWKEAYNQAVIFGKGKEMERSKLEIEGVELRRLVSDRESKNMELFKTGMEILKRYESFGLGDALSAKEPFIGNSKVKMQTLVQDYSDKLSDNRVGSESGTRPAAMGGTSSVSAGN